MKQTEFPDFESLFLFDRIVEFGSFSAVNKRLRIPKPTLSRKIARLEAFLGVQLLVRNTRSLRLTEKGKSFLRHAKTILSVIEDARIQTAEEDREPEGRLRISAGVEYGLAVLGPVVESFCAKHPAVSVELDLTGRMVDLVNEDFDLALRIGQLDDSSLSARRIGSIAYGLFASPSLLRGKRLRSPADLAMFPSLCFSRGEHRDRWYLVSDGRKTTVEVKPRLASNNHWVLKDAAISGLGVVYMPKFIAADALRSDRLVRVLPAWGSVEIPVHAVYPAQKYIAKNARSFIDHLVETISRNSDYSPRSRG